MKSWPHIAGPSRGIRSSDLPPPFQAAFFGLGSRRAEARRQDEILAPHRRLFMWGQVFRPAAAFQAAFFGLGSRRAEARRQDEILAPHRRPFP
jgi:hypothetical protein